VVRDKELSTSKKAPVEIETKTSLNGLLINHWRLVHSNLLPQERTFTPFCVLAKRKK
jgi:hypothetical protein